jgi:alkaline phosphatase
VVRDQKQLNSQSGLPLWGLFGDNNDAFATKNCKFLPYAHNRTGFATSLPQFEDLIRVTLERLANKPKTFIVASADRLDHAAHLNNNERLLAEADQFFNAARQLEHWVRDKSDGVLIVTADHAVNNSVHTASRVPLYVYGAQASRFENVSAPEDIRVALLGLRPSCPHAQPIHPQVKHALHSHTSSVATGSVAVFAVICAFVLWLTCRPTASAYIYRPLPGAYRRHTPKSN